MLYNENATTKSIDTIRLNVITTLTNYSTTNLQKFALFRYSQLIQDIDDTDTSILSNITTVKNKKRFYTYYIGAVTYNVYFRNALYNPHSHMTLLLKQNILESSYFTCNDNEMFLNDDDNVRMYYLVVLKLIKTIHKSHN